MWKKEVEILGRLASLGEKNGGSSGSSGEDGGDGLLEEWTGEVREVVLKYGGSAALVNETAKGNMKGKGKSKGSKRKKQTTSDEESEADESC